MHCLTHRNILEHKVTYPSHWSSYVVDLLQGLLQVGALLSLGLRHAECADVYVWVFIHSIQFSVGGYAGLPRDTLDRWSGERWLGPWQGLRGVWRCRPFVGLLMVSAKAQPTHCFSHAMR